jgi:hypothetical protein
MLSRDEYVEQAHFFRLLGERTKMNLPIQDAMADGREELLSTTQLPLAVGFLVSELRYSGQMASAMARMSHYFTPFQTFVIGVAEEARARLDFATALQILEREARYKAESPTPQGVFFYEFECVARNRLGYDHSLDAIAGDPIFDANWREWIGFVRRQIGVVELGDLIHARSEYLMQQLAREGRTLANPDVAILFGEKEGKIAWANRDKDPLYLFAALARHLNYPQVPRPDAEGDREVNLNLLLQLVKRLEGRVKLLEEEARGGIDLNKLYGPPPSASGDAS